MSLQLLVNNRDLTDYLAVSEDDFDPADPGFEEPTFAGAPAFSEGQASTGGAVGNREMVFPLILKAADTAALHQLVSDIKGDLQAGAPVQFQAALADDPTFFDLEGGRLEENFQHWLGRSGKLRATLRLWTRPYGHTGTSRELLSSAIGTGIIERVVTGVLGDVDAPGNLTVRVGSYLASNYVLAWAVTPNPSHVAMVPAASMTAQLSPTIIGASGVLASQYVGHFMAPTSVSASQFLVRFTATAQPGRHRVFAVVRNRLHPATALRLRGELQPQAGGLDQRQAFGPTALATVNNGAWMIVDLGDVNVPTRLSNEAAWNPEIRLYGAGASGASAVASPPVHTNAIVMLPLESAGLFVEDQLMGERRAISVQSLPRTRIVGHTDTTTDTVLRDRTGHLRGEAPRIPPTGSPVTTPDRMIVFAGNVDDFRGNDVLTTEVSVRERWRFLRP